MSFRLFDRDAIIFTFSLLVCHVLIKTQHDLTWCYKILFGYFDVSSDVVPLYILGVTPTNCSRNTVLSAAYKLLQWTCH